MRSFTFRRIGAAALLAVFLPSCADTVPTSPELIPEGPEETRVEKTKDEKGRAHEVELRTRGGYITHVKHDIDGAPFARLVYHYRAAPDGTYTLDRVTGRVTVAGKKVDVGSIWPQVRAAAKARDVRSALLASGASASALRDDCWYELGELAFWSAALATALTASPVSWPATYALIAGYISAMGRYDECAGKY